MYIKTYCVINMTRRYCSQGFELMCKSYGWIVRTAEPRSGLKCENSVESTYYSRRDADLGSVYTYNIVVYIIVVTKRNVNGLLKTAQNTRQCNSYARRPVRRI